MLAGAVGGLTSLAYLALLNAAKLLLWPGRTSALTHWVLLIAAGMVISVLLSVLGDPGPTGVLIESIHVAGGPPDLRPLRSLVPVSLLGIAVGGGIGPEPILMQTTATISTWIGRRLRASPAELRVLTVTGLASGLTVLFAAPLGAAVFALEILHRKGLEYYEALLPACAGSLVSYAIYAAITGRGLVPSWQFPGVSKHLTLPDLLIGACGGVAGAAVAHLFAFMIRTCARISAPLPSWTRPVAAGLALGALGLAVPTGLTYGESQLTALVTMPAVASASLLLAAAGHLASAAITLAGRWKGGIIIPMFFTGYCLGRAMAEMSGHDGWYLVLATSMMVACNTGMTKTPLGSALVVSEMTAVTLVPPLVIAALVSLFLTSGVAFVGGQRHREQPSPPLRIRQPLTQHTAPEPAGRPPAPRFPSRDADRVGQDEYDPPASRIDQLRRRMGDHGQPRVTDALSRDRPGARAAGCEGRSAGGAARSWLPWPARRRAGVTRSVGPAPGRRGANGELGLAACITTCT